MIVTPFNLAGPALILSARARLEAERANLTNFAAGTRGEGTGLGCSPLSVQPRAAHRPVAALYVETGGSYFDLPGVDAWDEARDARLYDGPDPVVAHPPCQRWGKFWAGAPWKIAMTGERQSAGDDGGCFAAALSAVRRFGGVLEHPEGSLAWQHFGLAKPVRGQGWRRADWPSHDGWTCCVEQGHYGHQARKPTWLYVSGVEMGSLPTLNWSASVGTYLDEALHGAAKVAHRKTMSAKYGTCQMINTRDRIKTPIPFRDLLLSIARTAALHDRPNNGTDLSRIPDLAPFHPSEVGHD